jgi:hypothetical protein
MLEALPKVLKWNGISFTAEFYWFTFPSESTVCINHFKIAILNMIQNYRSFSGFSRFFSRLMNFFFFTYTHIANWKTYLASHHPLTSQTSPFSPRHSVGIPFTFQGTSRDRHVSVTFCTSCLSLLQLSDSAYPLHFYLLLSNVRIILWSFRPSSRYLPKLILLDSLLSTFVCLMMFFNFYSVSLHTNGTLSVI